MDRRMKRRDGQGDGAEGWGARQEGVRQGGLLLPSPAV